MSLLRHVWDVLDQWFSVFLMLQAFNTAPDVVVTPYNHELFQCYFTPIILLLLLIVNI